ncbi:hypothetical protein AAE478_006766 [Parahypoxylon ruwenzoriense]
MSAVLQPQQQQQQNDWFLIIKAAPPPPPDLLGGAFSSLKQNVFDKFTRAPPAVDVLAANRAFIKPDQLTPVSASTGSQAISPKTPTHGRPSVGPGGDDYGPAIAGSPRRPSGYGGFRDSESYEGDSTYGTSPNKPTSFLSRMDNIVPGPFEIGRRPGAKNSFARNNSRDYTSDSNNDSLHVGYTLERPGTAGSSSSNRSGRSGRSGSIAPPRAPRKNGYGGFGPPQRDSNEFEPQPLGLGKRSETFPDKLLKANDEVFEAPARAPSAPGLRSDRVRGASKGNGDWIDTERSQRPSFGSQDALRPPPPRTSFARPPTRDGNGRSVNIAEEFGASNPYHSPSVSQSSSNSGFSRSSQPLSQASSNTSPARSVGSRAGVRRPSDMSGFDALLDDLQSSMDAMQTKGQPPSPEDRSRVEREPSPLNSSDRRPHPPEALRVGPARLGGRDPRPSPTIKSPSMPDFLPSDRDDPAVQSGLSKSPPAPVRPQHSRQPSRSRGNCKACGKLITGKSISSADGRLTGRYHKACFVCTTCQEPFSSATFYVLNDKPYCEQHYHKLNGSLCGSCNRGIEGQYLEDESSSKYHPRCFRCGDCGMVLRDGYFDVNGKAYCERDAWRRMQSAMQEMRRSQPHQLQPPNMRTQQPSPLRSSAQGPPPMRTGLPSGPGPKPRPLNQPFGLPTGNRLAPGQALGRGGLGPIPRMEKRMTRFGMM